MTFKTLSLTMVLAPLLGSIIAGLSGRFLSKRVAHSFSIGLIFVSLVCAIALAKHVLFDGQTWHAVIYTWGVSGHLHFNVSFLVDHLTAVMICIVTFVSLLVQIYSIGYMGDDPGYKRFFSYMSLFTFSMLCLLLANNFLLLFFGWEAVGLVSYLLIGFWFSKPSAASGSLKAFLVNRVGDFGFILGIAAILDYFGTINYQQVFHHASDFSGATMHLFGHQFPVLTVICVLLFIGAMGKSAQIPLHIWLPESMEGPTPISALIHAATMVTAGVYMVARMSPIFAFSPSALGMVMVLGATGALFLGILAFVENDIKRVIAYSTMSQLGYMMAADGAMAYGAGIFHLLMHACFKALLFLAAGSVIIAMHHEQDMRKMGGLGRYLPWTYATFLVGSLALAAIPPFSGFFSKDMVIDAVGLAKIPGATYSYWCLLIGSFVTGFYIFRAFFMTFHTKPRFSEDTKSHLHETPWTMRSALVLLAIPSVIAGYWSINWMLFKHGGILSPSLSVPAAYQVLPTLGEEFHGALAMIMHACMTKPFWFAVLGIFAAWAHVIGYPRFADRLEQTFPRLKAVLEAGFGFDWIVDKIFVQYAKRMSQFFYRVTDIAMIDEALVDGTGHRITRLAALIRRFQTGFLYHYVFAMVIGVIVFALWLFIH